MKGAQESFGCICFLNIFWLCLVACGILVPQPGIEPLFPALEVQSLNCWHVREVPASLFLRGCQVTSSKEMLESERDGLTLVQGEQERAKGQGM